MLRAKAKARRLLNTCIDVLRAPTSQLCRAAGLQQQELLWPSISRFWMKLALRFRLIHLGHVGATRAEPKRKSKSKTGQQMKNTFLRIVASKIAWRQVFVSKNFPIILYTNAA